VRPLEPVFAVGQGPEQKVHGALALDTRLLDPRVRLLAAVRALDLLAPGLEAVDLRGCVKVGKVGVLAAIGADGC
jgi:hypothetical protein